MGSKGKGKRSGDQANPRLGSGRADLKAFLLLGEIAFFGGMTIVYKSSIDLLLYVVGSSSENEVNLGCRVTKEGLSWGGGGLWMLLLLSFL